MANDENFVIVFKYRNNLFKCNNNFVKSGEVRNCNTFIIRI